MDLKLALLLAALAAPPDWLGTGDDAPDWIGSMDADHGAAKDSPQARPVVFAYVSRGCAPCERLKRDTRDDEQFRWRLVAQQDWPAWVTAAPTLHWQGRDGWRQSRGWSGLAAFAATWSATQHGKESGGLSLSPAGPWGAAAVRDGAAAGFHRGLYYHGQTQWSWPGDLRTHLMAEHGLSRATVQGWSDVQCMAWHNATHNGTRSSGRRRRGLFAAFGG